ncbi:allophanate hydrolase subunit 1 [Leifsonia bigeumensis]|uniref:Allophanate hydrolase subunit 1 n=1 Tax=Leifsonella bigeumensis TaxID=433643 RepID=A0ABP7FYQ7_9MICO
MKVLPFGDRALLAEFESLDEAMGAFRALEAARAPGVIELVPAARTVLVRIDPGRMSLTAARNWLESTRLDTKASATGAIVTIPVRYDGPDLASTAEILGLSTDELVSRHSGTAWRCAFIGFAPGFAYLVDAESTGGRAGLDVPRRATSREAVPAGAVGLAGEFTGIYPRSSPGGWQLIATTEVTLFDPDREHPALIAPGTTVRFEVVEP